jgi:DNA-binding winged helix-turn-helix (wHTH) protein/tetratricopeptide (TPR) repeat protein
MEQKALYRFGSFEVDAAERVLRREGTPMALPPKAFDTLLILVERSGTIVTRQDLLAAVWPDVFVEENNLTQYISLLRRTLEDERQAPRFIETVARRGYRFCAEVERVEEAPAVFVLEATASAVRRVPGRRLAWLWAGLVAACGVIAVTVYASVRVPPPLVLGSAPATVAVLPYRVAGNVEGDSFAGMALADDLIRGLRGSAGQMKVRTVSAVWRYAESMPAPVIAARELGVDYAVANGLERRGRTLVLHAQVVRAIDGKAVWHGSFSGGDAFALQEQLVERLRGGEAVQPVHLSRNLKAYAELERGQRLLDLRTAEGIYKATDALEGAVAADPGFAAAHALLANAYAFDVYHWPQAERVARKAMTLDGTLGAPHASVGFVKMMWQGDVRGSDEELKLAVRMNPGDATAHQWHADNLAMQGRVPESIEEMKVAEALDPDSVPIHRDLAHMYYLAHDFDAAERMCRQTIEMAPDFLEAHVLMHDIYTQKHEYDRAMTEFEQAERLAPVSGLYPLTQDGALKQAYAKEGIRGFWRARLDYLEHRFREDYLAAKYTALLGDYPRAMAYLRLSADKSNPRPRLNYLWDEPAFERLHGNEEFRRLSGMD